MLIDERSFLQALPLALPISPPTIDLVLETKFRSNAVPLDGFPRLLSWTERIAAIGHGRRSPTTSKKALDAASDAMSIAA